MTLAQFLLSEKAFCIWLSYFNELGIPYGKASRRVRSACSRGKPEEDVLRVFANAKLGPSYLKALKAFVRRYDRESSPVRKLRSLNGHYQDQVANISSEVSATLMPTGVRSTAASAVSYFYWLQSHGVADCGGIDCRNTLRFLGDNAKSNSFMNTLIPRMRKVFKALRDMGYDNVPDTILGYKAAPRRNIILSAFSGDEIDRMLSANDCTTFKGLRDFTILTLISMTGFRPGDVRRLKLSNIDFKNRVIDITQSKTGALLRLPMDRILAGVLSIYVRKARRMTGLNDNRILFPSATDWRSMMSGPEMSRMFKGCMERAGIEGGGGSDKSLYTFRRTIGKWLLESGSRPETIASVLGHRSLGSFKHYVAISPSTLKKVALDFRWAGLKEARNG